MVRCSSTPAGAADMKIWSAVCISGKRLPGSSGTVHPAGSDAALPRCSCDGGGARAARTPPAPAEFGTAGWSSATVPPEVAPPPVLSTAAGVAGAPSLPSTAA